MANKLTNSDIINQSMFAGISDEQFKQLWADFRDIQLGCDGTKKSLLLDYYMEQAQVRYGRGFTLGITLELAKYACARLDDLL